MSGSDERKPGVRVRPRPDQATVPNQKLTEVLNTRVRREVALEKAAEPEPPVEDGAEARVQVVLGPDGVPQIADVAEHAPETVRVEVADAGRAPTTKSGPPSKG